MKFTIQKEEDLPKMTVIINEEQDYAEIPETPNLVSSTSTEVFIIVPGFAGNINGNNVAAQDKGIYLVSLEESGDLSINKVGG